MFWSSQYIVHYYLFIRFIYCLLMLQWKWKLLKLLFVCFCNSRSVFWHDTFHLYSFVFRMLSREKIKEKKNLCCYRLRAYLEDLEIWKCLSVFLNEKENVNVWLEHLLIFIPANSQNWINHCLYCLLVTVLSMI